MPRKAPTPCRDPSCAKLCNGSTDEYKGYCSEHANNVKRQQQRRSRAKRRNNQQQQTLDKFYHTTAWRTLRSAFISKYPLCKMCTEAGKVVPADVVDHIVERRDGGSDLDPRNLQSLCHACHNDKTQQERRNRNAPVE